MFLFINKAWGYGDENPDHYFLALNYRISELQGAVALAQLEKLDGVVQNRIKTANLMSERLQDIPGILPPEVEPQAVHSYWKYVVRVDSDIVAGGAVGFGAQLCARGIACAPCYIQKPAFACEIFQKQRTFGKSGFPFTLARPEAIDYRKEFFPGTFAGLETIVVLPWNELYTEEHVDYLAHELTAAALKCTQD